MTNTLLWTALYVFIALVVVAVVVRGIKGLLRRNEPRGPFRRPPGE
ncbi:hypothetical protein [Ramlibacter sp. AN1133]